MNSPFIWLANPYDVSVVAEKLGKSWSEIEDHLWDDWRNREVTLFYIPDGTHRKFKKGTYERVRKGALEYLFWGEIWDRQIEWENVIARVWEDKSDAHGEPEVRFFISSVIDGENNYSSFRMLKQDMDDTYLGPDGMFRAVLDNMVKFIDHRAKEERYGVFRY